MDALHDKGLTWHKKWENPLLPFEGRGIPSRHPKSTALPLGQGASSSLCLRTQLGAHCLSLMAGFEGFITPIFPSSPIFESEGGEQVSADWI